MQPTINLLVLRSKDLDECVAFYRSLGIEFSEERHGSGPKHFAAALGATVLEIYASKMGESIDSSSRIGLSFREDEIPDHLKSPPLEDTPWGCAAVLRDPDGRFVVIEIEAKSTRRSPDSTQSFRSAAQPLTADAAPIGEQFKIAVIETFRSQKALAERAITQLDDIQLKESLDPAVNSIAVIMKHVSGNLISRWTDFLTTDGEKPSRGRDLEFVDTFATRAELLAHWQRGWNRLLETLQQLETSDLGRVVQIRGQDHTVALAIERSLGHTCYHVGQIIQQARALAGDRWTTLTIPRGESERYNREHWGNNKPS